jgi:hypothetical protein
MRNEFDSSDSSDTTLWDVAYALGEPLPAPFGSKIFHITVETEGFGLTRILFEGFYSSHEDGVTELARYCLDSWNSWEGEPWRNAENLDADIATVMEATGFDYDAAFDELGIRWLNSHSPQNIVDSYFADSADAVAIREKIVAKAQPWSGGNEFTLN